MLSALALAGLLAAAPAPVAAARPDPWAALRFLVGEWEGLGAGTPGQGGGRFSFALDLGDQVLVRRAHSAYAGKQGPVVHDDLLVVHAGEGGLRARYWDNEGHVIDYAVAASPDGKVVTFVSAPGKGPRFRLTYQRLEGDRVMVRFAVAPLGEPEAFRTYVEGESRRLGAPR